MKKSDRRLASRFSIKTPLYVRRWRSAEAERRLESVNVSETGVYFETDAPPPEGAVVHIRLEMPSAITGTVGIEWHCIGKWSESTAPPTPFARVWAFNSNTTKPSRARNSNQRKAPVPS